MSMKELFQELHELGVKLWVEDDELRFRSPKGALTPLLRSRLREHKAEIVAFLQQAQNRQRPNAIQPVPRPVQIPLTVGQKRMWMLDQVGVRSAYNIPMALKLRGRLQVDVLTQVLTEIVHRHEVLRTTVAVQRDIAHGDGNDAVYQVIHDARTVALPLIDLRHYAGNSAEQEAQIKQLFAAEIARPFDLARDLMLRGALFHIADEEYLLLLNVHHFASDGWSQYVMLQEAATLYRAFAQGKPSPLPDLPIQYADFAIWQRQWMQETWVEQQLEYWRKQLAGIPERLQLPTDRPRPPEPSFEGHTMHFTVEAELAQALRKLSQQAETTLFTTLLTAFQILLARYTGENDLVVGTLSDNRSQPELEPLIGLFINILILRADLSGNPSFKTLLAQTKSTTEDAYSHRDLPFAHLVDALEIKSTLSYHPLAQVFFRLRRQPITDFDLPGVQVSLYDFAFKRTGLSDLDVMLQETDHQIDGYCFYNSELFDAATIERLLEHYKCLLAAIISDPEQSIYTLPMLTDAERQQLLVAWNQTQATTLSTDSIDECIHYRFEKQVKRTPEATALVSIDDDTASLSYAELNRRANRLAHYLQHCGVAPGTRVGICMERSAEMVIALLAVLKAGGAYVPLDPAYPSERLAFMIEDSQLTVLLTQGGLVSMPNHGDTYRTAEGALGNHADGLEQLLNNEAYSNNDRVRVIDLEQMAPTIQQQPEHNLSVSIRPDDLIYVIYTSGSTGQPKGAGVYHRGFTNLLHWYIQELGMTHADRVMLITALSFDLTQKNIFAPLLCGGRLYLSTELFDPVAICQAVDAHAITWLNCTPSMFAYLVEEDLRREQPGLAPLRSVVLGGEPIAMSQFAEWLARPQTNVTLVNSYGPTECTDVCAAYVMEEPAQFGENSVPIGRPIPNVQLYVLDPHEQPVPVGHIGELCIAGAGVGAGYLQRPALTDAKFIPNPFVDLSTDQQMDGQPQRLYKTGDLVRYLPDGGDQGCIEFVGRMDNQVKIRGFRIEIGEIEAALGGHPAVREAVVVTRANQYGDPRLEAYVVAENQAPSNAPSAAELRSYLAERLPDYMIPAAFQQVAAFPLTPSGKINRNALSIPELPEAGQELQQPVPGSADISPVSDSPAPSSTEARLEQEMAAIWSEILGRPEIESTDNFFALGGDSFLAVRAIARLNEQGLALTLRDIFTAPTIAGLAIRLQEKMSAEQLDAFWAQKDTEARTEDADAQEETRKPVVSAPNDIDKTAQGAAQSSSTNSSTSTSMPAVTPAVAAKHLVPIQPDGSRLPFFCVHPIMGGVATYYSLATLMGSEQPFYGLSSQGFDKSQPRPRTIEEIASRYIHAIRTVQPEGPYHLGGWSFGGWVAFEMAQQLVAQGDTVSALVVIDTAALGQKRSAWDHLRSLWEFTQLLGRYIWPYVSNSQYLSIALADFMEGKMEPKDNGPDEPLPSKQLSRLDMLRHPAVRHGWRTFMAHNRATLRYSPRPYAGTITVLRAAEQPNIDAMDLGWGRLAEMGVEIKPVSGDHMTVLRQPHVQSVADSIRAVLAEKTYNQASAAAQGYPTHVNGNPQEPARSSTPQTTRPPVPAPEPASVPGPAVSQPKAFASSNVHAGHNGNRPAQPAHTADPIKQTQPSSPRLSPSTPTADETTRKRPQNGREYLNSLRDGREVWIYGQRVKDVTAHPAFRNQSRMVARWYDALHDPEQQPVLTGETDNGSEGYTHPFFRASYTTEHLGVARDALAAWHRIGYGWMGRGPDYMAGALGMLGPNAEFYAPYQANALRWYQQFQTEMPYVCHAISNPPVDRHRPPDEVEDVYIHAIEETDAGIIVSGAKNITTNSALSQYAFVGQDGGAHVRTKSFATTFLVAMNTPGIKVICRPSYEMTAGVMGTPFDYPLSSRMDENDAILIFDEVLVPWENVLVYGDLEKQNQHIARTGFFPRSGLQSSTRLAVKFDLIAGLLLKAVEATGVNEFRGVQVHVGEVLTWRHLFWSLSDAMANTAVKHNGVEHNGAVVPKIEHMMAHRMLMSVAYPRIKEITSQLIASGLIFQPSSALDFKTPELRPYLEKYVRGAAGDAEQRVKLMKTLWDAIGTEFAGRHELYERNNLGNHEAVRLHALFHSIGAGTEEALKQFADRCMEEVDLDGWTAPDLINPDDLHEFHQWIAQAERGA